MHVRSTHFSLEGKVAVILNQKYVTISQILGCFFSLKEKILILHNAYCCLLRYKNPAQFLQWIPTSTRTCKNECWFFLIYYATLKRGWGMGRGVGGRGVVCIYRQGKKLWDLYLGVCSVESKVDDSHKKYVFNWLAHFFSWLMSLWELVFFLIKECESLIR